MGEKETRPFQLSFNGLLKVDLNAAFGRRFAWRAVSSEARIGVWWVNEKRASAGGRLMERPAAGGGRSSAAPPESVSSRKSRLAERAASESVVGDHALPYRRARRSSPALR